MDRIVGSLDAHAALEEMCNGFFDGLNPATSAEWVSAADLPRDYRLLLDHHDHMTRRLSEHWSGTMALEVLYVQRKGEDYRRKILLRPSSRDTVAELGIARVWLAHIPPAAREEIVTQRAPLGEIFERHALLRQVEPRAYARFGADSSVLEYFTPEPPKEVFGRIATISCDGRPAVELLEIVRTRNSAESS